MSSGSVSSGEGASDPVCLAPSRAVGNSPSTSSGALGALVVLTGINLFNYLDRYLIAGVLPDIEAELGIGHAEAGLLGSVFIVVYMVLSPIAGFLGDRYPRRILIALSVAVWSLATLYSGLAGSFLALLLARALVGVGEAGYGAAAPALLADHHPPHERGRVLAIFYAAIPIGAAAGYALGGLVTQWSSWRLAFVLGGAPGLLLALLALSVRESPRTRREGFVHPTVKQAVTLLLRSPTFLLCSLGTTLMTFSIGGLAYWMPSFLQLARGFEPGSAGILFGGITALAGTFGTLIGGTLGDRSELWRPGASLKLSGLGLILAAPLLAAIAIVHLTWALLALIFVGQVLVFLNSGPVNAAIVGAVSSERRAFAIGLHVLLIHVLGDAISPPIIGLIAERSSLDVALAVNALPLLLGGLLFLLAGRRWATHGREREAT